MGNAQEGGRFVKVPLEEFDRFWDDVLGDDWYIEDYDLGYEDGEFADISAFEIQWQGSGEPSANDYIKEREIDVRGRTVLLSVSPTALFRRWRKAQVTTTIVAVFEAPKDEAAALVEQIKALGGKVKP